MLIETESCWVPLESKFHAQQGKLTHQGFTGNRFSVKRNIVFRIIMFLGVLVEFFADMWITNH